MCQTAGVARGRRHSKHTRPHRPLAPGLGAERAEQRDGSWVVRDVPGAAATKVYTCPGCSRPIPAGTPHLVAWPTSAVFGRDVGVEARRHWHSGCWRRR